MRSPVLGGTTSLVRGWGLELFLEKTSVKQGAMGANRV